MEPPSRNKWWFTLFSTIIIIVLIAHLSVEGPIIGALYLAADEAYVMSCSVYTIREDPLGSQYRMTHPTPEQCIDAFDDFCAYRPLRFVAPIPILILWIGGPASLFLLKRHYRGPKTPLVLALVVNLTMMGLSLLLFPRQFYLALRTLYMFC
jgi:hypothetical protein